MTSPELDNIPSGEHLPEEWRKIQDEYETGFSLRQIASRNGKSRNSITKFLEAQGCFEGREPLKEQLDWKAAEAYKLRIERGWEWTRIARHCGYSERRAAQRSVRNYCRRKGLALPPGMQDKQV